MYTYIFGIPSSNGRLSLLLLLYAYQKRGQFSVSNSIIVILSYTKRNTEIHSENVHIVSYTFQIDTETWKLVTYIEITFPKNI